MVKEEALVWINNMSSEYLTFAKVFDDLSEPHRVVSFSELGVYEFQHMRQHVIQLYNVLKNKYRPRVVINFESPYYSAVAFLAAAFACKDIILIGGNIEDDYLYEYIDSDEIVLSDKNITKYYNANVLQISKLLINCYEDVDFASQVLPEFNAKDVTFSLLSGDEGEVRDYPRSIASIEEELNSTISCFPQLLEQGVFSYTLPPTHGFDIVHCSLMAVLARGSLLAKQVISQQALAQLSTMNFVFITSSDFLDNIDPDLVVPRASIVFSIGGNLSKGTTLTAYQSFHCPIIQMIGSLHTGCLGYRDALISNSFKLFKEIKYFVNNEYNLVITKNFINEEPFTTNYIVAENNDAITIIGEKDRVITIKGSTYSLKTVEDILMDTGKIVNAVAVALRDGDLGETYVGVVVSIPDEMIHILENSKNKSLFIMELRNDLQGKLPEELIPRKVRFLDKILYNANGRVDYQSLLNCFSQNSYAKS